jgi:hypothetical protein
MAENAVSGLFNNESVITNYQTTIDKRGGFESGS